MNTVLLGVKKWLKRLYFSKPKSRFSLLSFFFFNFVYENPLPSLQRSEEDSRSVLYNQTIALLLNAVDRQTYGNIGVFVEYHCRTEDREDNKWLEFREVRQNQLWNIEESIVVCRVKNLFLPSAVVHSSLSGDLISSDSLNTFSNLH